MKYFILIALIFSLSSAKITYAGGCQSVRSKDTSGNEEQAVRRREARDRRELAAEEACRVQAHRAAEIQKATRVAQAQEKNQKTINLYRTCPLARNLEAQIVSLEAECAALKIASKAANAAKSAQQPAAAPKLFSLSDGAAVQKGPAAQIKLKPYPTTVQFKAPFVATSGARWSSSQLREKVIAQIDPRINPIDGLPGIVVSFDFACHLEGRPLMGQKERGAAATTEYTQPTITPAVEAQIGERILFNYRAFELRILELGERDQMDNTEPHEVGLCQRCTLASEGIGEYCTGNRPE